MFKLISSSGRVRGAHSQLSAGTAEGWEGGREGGRKGGQQKSTDQIQALKEYDSNNQKYFCADDAEKYTSAQILKHLWFIYRFKT